MLHLVNITLGLLNLAYRGFVIKTFWAWFILTQFSGLPRLTTLSAIGILTTVGTFRMIKSLSQKEIDDFTVGLSTPKDTKDKVKLGITNGALLTAGLTMMLGAGYLLHLIMG
jgi:hypothetical protein